MRTFIKFLVASALLVCLAECSTPNEKVVVATAANVQFVMKELQKAFESESDIRLDIVVGSSGKLTTQIREGAPFDLFVSADTRYPQEVFANGGGDAPPKIYARGALVLFSGDSTQLPQLADLINPAIKKIALANPATAPYGRAAVEVLQKSGMYDRLKSKLVYGESIAQTTQYVETGAADVGFTALSVVLSPEMRGKGRYTRLDSTTYAPIDQAAIILRHSDTSPKRQKSREFYDFLFSEKAKAIFRKYGYSVD